MSLTRVRRAPSVASLKKAMQTYARQGGTSNIFVNDDGLQVRHVLPRPAPLFPHRLPPSHSFYSSDPVVPCLAAPRRRKQLLSDRERSARIAFYDAHGIGWVARPPHGGAGGFVRAGRFKKASNMNYGLALSRKAEQHLLAIQAQEQEQALRASVDGAGHASGSGSGGGSGGGSAEEEREVAMEERALMAAVEEVYEESGRRWRPWAKNGRACRLGEIILLVDSDTVVPEVSMSGSRGSCSIPSWRLFFEADWRLA